MSHLSTNIFSLNKECGCSTILPNNYFIVIKFFSVDYQLIENTVDTKTNLSTESLPVQRTQIQIHIFEQQTSQLNTAASNTLNNRDVFEQNEVVVHRFEVQVVYQHRG